MSGLAAPITGDGVRADPMAEAHRAALKAACAEDLAIWDIFALNFGPEQFDASFDRIMALPWARFVLFDEAGDLIGMSSFLNIVEDRQLLEIGNTYYRPRFRGTGINHRIKDMMMRRAFECGYTRIEYRVDLRNLRSQAAMAKLGAAREGVMRKDRTTWTGHRRDTVLFSILKDEWPPAEAAR
ncbi:MAG: GNAT family N-acetyltransferase [Sphingomicrobium sp.]|nr:GNAT family N-acetyltransferase [Sphingomonadales bacterium]